MGVTITKGLDADFAAFAPVLIEGVTTRHPFNDSGDRAEMAIDTIKGDNGKLNISHTSAVLKDAEADDTVLIKGLTGEAEALNGFHKIETVKGDSSITMTTIYPGVQLDLLGGTCYRMNENLMVRANVYEVIDDGGTPKPMLINYCYAKVDSTGKFNVDISKVVQMALGSQFALDNSKVNEVLVRRGSKNIEVTFSEVFLATNFSMTVVEDMIAKEEGIAHRSADIKDMFTTRLPINNMYAGDKVIIRAYIKADEVDFDASPAVVPAVRINGTFWYPMVWVNNNAMYVHAIDSDVTTIEIGKGQDATFTRLRDTITIVKPGTCTGKRLYFLNNEGGFSVMEVHKFENTKAVERIDRYVVDNYTERVLYGIEEHDTTGVYLKDLISSPEVYDETGAVVEVLETEMMYVAEEIVPIVRIKIKENFIQ